MARENCVFENTLFVIGNEGRKTEKNMIHLRKIELPNWGRGSGAFIHYFYWAKEVADKMIEPEITATLMVALQC